jgi:MFS family permease
VVLFIGGIGLVPAAAMWAMSDNFWYLLGVQVATGAVWACYEIATFLLLFETIPSGERTSVLSLFNFANTLAIVCGSLVGATLLGVMGEGIGAYHTLFVLSSGLRLLTLPLLFLLRMPRFEAVAMEVQPMSLRPGMGSLNRPILAQMAEDPAEDLHEAELVE